MLIVLSVFNIAVGAGETASPARWFPHYDRHYRTLPWRMGETVYRTIAKRIK
jgi:hypothetical protein